MSVKSMPSLKERSLARGMKLIEKLIQDKSAEIDELNRDQTPLDDYDTAMNLV